MLRRSFLRRTTELRSPQSGADVDVSVIFVLNACVGQPSSLEFFYFIAGLPSGTVVRFVRSAVRGWIQAKHVQANTSESTAECAGVQNCQASFCGEGRVKRVSWCIWRNAGQLRMIAGRVPHHIGHYIRGDTFVPSRFVASNLVKCLA